VSKSRAQEARALLTKFHTGGDENSPLVDLEIREISESIEIEKAAASTR
jgi:hypothetical protein